MTAPEISHWDPLGYSVELPFEEVFYALGFPLLIRSNDPAVLAAAAISFPGGGGGNPAPVATIDLRVEGGEFAAPVFAARENLLLAIGGKDCFVAADCERSYGYGVVSRSLVQSQADFRYFYLEFLAYTLLCDQFLTPLHGSCVALDGRGVLITAPPGTGKSCLAYACLQAGFSFVTDDAAYLNRRERGVTVVGRPHSLRLSPSAIELFPELQALRIDEHAGGEKVIEIRPARNAVSRAELCAIVFLDREGPAQLRPIEPSETFERLAKELPRGRAGVFEQQLESLRRLSQLPAFELGSGDVKSAVEAIKLQCLAGR